VLWQREDSGHVGVWLMKNGTELDQYLPLTPDIVPDLSWKIVGVGDYNGDGQPDILWQRKTSGHVGVWIMKNGTELDRYVPLTPASFQT